MDKVFTDLWLVFSRRAVSEAFRDLYIEYRLFSESISGCTPDVKRGKIVSKLDKNACQYQTASMCILVRKSAQVLHNSLRRTYVLIKIYVYLGFYDQLQFLDKF